MTPQQTFAYNTRGLTGQQQSNLQTYGATNPAFASQSSQGAAAGGYGGSKLVNGYNVSTTAGAVAAGLGTMVGGKYTPNAPGAAPQSSGTAQGQAAPTQPSSSFANGVQPGAGGQAQPGVAAQSPTTNYANSGAAGGTTAAGGTQATNPLSAGGGQLNFGSVPTNYDSAYSNALNLNSQNYSNILSGYQNLIGGQQAGQSATQGRYDSLWPQVQQTIAGIGKSQQQAINDTYAQQSGNITQQMTNSGLGNTTAATSAQGVASLNQQKASDALAAQVAQLSAGYQSQLGLAGAGYSGQANQQNTQLGSQALNWMNSVNAPYPNVQQWQNTASMQGAAGAYKPVTQTNPYAGTQNPYAGAQNPYPSGQPQQPGRGGGRGGGRSQPRNPPQPPVIQGPPGPGGGMGGGFGGFQNGGGMGGGGGGGGGGELPPPSFEGNGNPSSYGDVGTSGVGNYGGYGGDLNGSTMSGSTGYGGGVITGYNGNPLPQQPSGPSLAGGAAGYGYQAGNVQPNNNDGTMNEAWLQTELGQNWLATDYGSNWANDVGYWD